MPTTKRKRNTKSAKKTKAKAKKTKEKTTTTRMEEEKVEDVPAGDDAMEVDENDSSYSEDLSGFGDIRLSTVFITFKVQLSARTKLLEKLRQKYIDFFTTIMEVDESVMVDTVNPDKKGEPIKTLDNFPAKMTGIRNYFYSSGKPPKINPKSDNPPWYGQHQDFPSTANGRT